MAFADSIRTKAATMEGVATLLESVLSTPANLVSATYTPTITATAPFTFTSTSVSFAQYFRIGNLILFSVNFAGTAGGTLSNVIRVSIPVTAINRQIAAAVRITEGGVFKGGQTTTGSTTTIDVRKYDSSNFAAGSTDFCVYGFYEAA